MGLFSNANKITTLKGIYDKAKYGTLKCQFSKTLQGHKIESINCNLQLEETNKDYLVKITTEENEIYLIRLTK